MTTKQARPDWGRLFEGVLAEPGRLGTYYSLFRRYSLGNQVLAVEQMQERGIQVGPIASFNAWRKVGRIVRKGEKAIALWMPIVKKEVVRKDDGTEEESVRQFFVMKNNWFALSQTDPMPDAENAPDVPDTPQWDKAQALAKLGITEVAFEHVDGNCQGYAHPQSREVAVNPLAALPWKTLFHEMAHCLLHGGEAEAEFVDSGHINRSIEEAEAEAVAMLCCATLGLPGIEECRGYIQNWLDNAADREAFLKKSASRVFSAADKILKAGSAKANEASQEVEVGHA